MTIELESIPGYLRVISDDFYQLNRDQIDSIRLDQLRNDYKLIPSQVERYSSTSKMVMELLTRAKKDNCTLSIDPNTGVVLLLGSNGKRDTLNLYKQDDLNLTGYTTPLPSPSYHPESEDTTSKPVWNSAKRESDDSAIDLLLSSFIDPSQVQFISLKHGKDNYENVLVNGDYYVIYNKVQGRLSPVAYMHKRYMIVHKF